METVVICEGCSSAVLYAEEALTRGYRVIVVNPPRECNTMAKYIDAFKNAVGDRVEFVNMKDADEYGPLVEKLKKSNVAAVVAGSDFGIPYADRLSKDLGLIGNDPATTYLRTTKYGMFEALKKAGIRKIETAVVKNEGDIDRFWEENDIETAFMKPNVGTSSRGNKICATRDEAKEHFRKLLGMSDNWGNESDILIQEYIGGTEYIVNTVSRGGRHYVTDIWRYNKLKTDGGETIYDTTHLLTEAETGIQELIRYVYDVLDAVDLKYGPCHGEFKIDKKGPVLIETNARPMGGNMKSRYLDECLGHHIADLALDCFIPGRDTDGLRFFNPKKMAGTIDIPIPYDVDADLSTLDLIAKSMETYRSCDPPIVPGVKHYRKTVDLESSPHCIKLCGNKADVEKGLELLNKLIFKYPEILFSNDELPKKGGEPDGKMLEFCRKKGGEIFSESYGRLSEMYSDIAKRVSAMPAGRCVYILPNVYENAPYGPVSVEMMLQIVNVRLETPMHENKDIVWGTKL